MARLMHGFLVLVALIVAYGAIEVIAAREEIPYKTDPSDPWYGQKLPPQPRKGYYKFLGNCLNVITRQCGRQVLDYVFFVKKIDDNCCSKLTKMGKLCNKSLSWTLSHIDKFKARSSVIIRRSDEAFDICSRRKK
ncbi:hypothetical protein RJ640_019200 [Escallonia rubra]|uniref:Prolamin-like domain-containing protein n=1 Tax=Escallonia rubra TaxID=112253 RepID=A0AA88UAI3_9ASTE|nr:hypothetical protein RJ640_019199 [Escallonia rubra]KAK2976980.1 hypothetical protein RJ640_019200 [Escallonia rubra]